jgi:hypothetical protein
MASLVDGWRRAPTRAVLLLLLVVGIGCAKKGLAEIRPPAGRKVLLLAIDGLDYDVLKPVLPQVPKLVDLRKHGLLVPLYGERASMDPYSIGLDPAESWTTLATGFSPTRSTDSGGAHGVRNLTVPCKGRYEELPVTSQHRRSMNFWDVLGAAGVKSAICGWWSTWPAEPVNGYLVSDRWFLEKFGLSAFGPAGRVDLPSMPEDYRHGAQHLTWPEALGDELAAALKPKVTQPGGDIFKALAGLQATATGETLRSLRQVEQSMRTDFAVKDALVALLKKDPEIRFATCYLDSLDVASHLFWMHVAPQNWIQNMDPTIRAKLPKNFQQYQNVLPMVAITMDRLVKELCEAMGPDALVMIVSDHAVQEDPEAGNRDFSLNPLLEKLDLLARAPDGSIDWKKTKCFDHTGWPRNIIRYVAMNFEGEWPHGFVPAGSPLERTLRWSEVQDSLMKVKISRNYQDASGMVKNDFILSCRMGDNDSIFVIFQLLPGDTNVILPSGVSFPLGEIFPLLPSSGRHAEPGSLLLSYPGELGERQAKRGLPMGKSGAFSRHVAPLVLALFGIPASERDDESGPNADYLYWLLDLEEAQRISVMPHLSSYEEAVGFADPARPLGKRRAELHAMLEGMGYDFESSRSWEVVPK